MSWPDMSLRLRLSLLITAISLVLLAGATVLVIDNARSAVAGEMRSTAHLALRLLEIAAGGDAREGGDPRAALLARLEEFDETRHLAIELRGAGGVTAVSRPGEGARRRPPAPAWFVRLVEPPPLELVRAVAGSRLPPGELVIRADPTDEIGEAWEEARALLGMLLLFTVAANAAVYLVLGHALRPIDGIIAGLDAIGRGEFGSRLPRPALPELRRIAEKIDRIAGDLARSSAQTRHLTRRSLAIQEQERRYLAHELHDELGQSISAINAVAESISKRTARETPAVAASAGTITEIARHVHDVIRAMTRRLRPATLDELGLGTALDQLIAEWNERHADVVCTLHRPRTLDRLGESEAITVYRIVQESLTNVANHAGATRVEVTLAWGEDPGTLHLEIADDGQGMDPRTTPRGLGLLGIEERVAALGGTFALESRPGAGACLRIEVPLSGEPAREATS